MPPHNEGDRTMRGEEVNGIVVGGDFVTGQLFYDGRSQSQKLYAQSESELMEYATELMNKLKAENGGYPTYLYQDNNKWELRIYN